jgi:hypothetical protein
MRNSAYPHEITKNQYLSSTNPPISQNGQTLVFELGDIAVNNCGSFQVQYAVGCDNSIIGQTICTEAHAFPDSLCGQPWAGPNLEINGFCDGDSVLFTIMNTGGDMPAAQGYIVIEDNLIMMSGEVQLLAGQSTTVAITAVPSATYHMLAMQDPDLPASLGHLIASASIEGCLGSVNPGAFNQIPQDDGEPWLDIDCHPVVASFDPNDKTGFPTGWTEEHLIDEHTDLDYLIRFQNTGTDTAFRVVIIDTLSAFLDPATVKPGASSHSYRFEMSGQGVAKFTLDDIMLPDSNVNEPLSHGFVKFHIAQQPGNPPGTVIENTVGIYFDYNAPIYTNTTLHKVREPWIQVIIGSVEMFAQKMQVSVSPNPMSDWATIEAANLPPGENTLLLSDAMGREVQRLPFSEGRAHLQRSGLAAGVYFFRVENGGKVLAAGKLVVR